MHCFVMISSSSGICIKCDPTLVFQVRQCSKISVTRWLLDILHITQQMAWTVSYIKISSLYILGNRHIPLSGTSAQPFLEPLVLASLDFRHFCTYPDHGLRNLVIGRNWLSLAADHGPSLIVWQMYFKIVLKLKQVLIAMI